MQRAAVFHGITVVSLTCTFAFKPTFLTQGIFHRYLKLFLRVHFFMTLHVKQTPHKNQPTLYQAYLHRKQ